MFTLIITLIFGIILGLLLACGSLWLIKIKCPNCKKLKPLHQIICWHWKNRTITGQACQHCQKPQPQISKHAPRTPN